MLRNGTYAAYFTTALSQGTGIAHVEDGKLTGSDSIMTYEGTYEVDGSRFRFNISPDLQVNSYVQYDNGSELVGTNTRLRWTFKPVADLFVVYNHNVRDLLDRWRLDSNQLLVKLQYAFRY